MASRTLPDILTDAEEQLLLSQFNRRYPTSYRNRCMIQLALATGMRQGDLVNLRWEDIELDSGRTHVKKGKGQKDRVIFIRPSVLSDLVDLAAMFGGTSGRVFQSLKVKGGPVDASYLRKLITRKAKAAGIEKRVYFHLLRHTYLTKLYAKTKDIRLTQEVAGHADISTTMIYTHVSGEDVRAAMVGEDEPDEETRTLSALEQALQTLTVLGSGS